MALATLGEGSYTVRFVRRQTRGQSAIPRGAPQQLIEGSWNRTLSATSDATATFGLDADRSDRTVLRSLRAWWDVMEMWRDGVIVWAGPVQEVLANPEQATCTVTAKDLSAWFALRVLGRFVHRQTDLATIYAEYVAAAFDADDPGIVVVTRPTGILADKTIAAADLKMLSDALSELASSGVDWSCCAHTFFVGGQTVAESPRLPIRLTDESFRFPPATRRSGAGQANDVYTRGNKFVGHYGGADAVDGVLLQAVHDASSITDQGSADADARRWWGESNGELSYLDGDNALDSGAFVDVNQLVPGYVVPVDVSGGDVAPVFADLRLAKVSASIDAQGETVSVGLNPPGDPIPTGA